VAPGASQTFDQTGSACLAANCVGAATVTSTEAIVASVMQVQIPGAKNLLAYNGFVSASAKPIMPLVTTGFFGSITGIQIQNTGAVSTSVTMAYAPSPTFPGNACQETKDVAPGASTTFFLPVPAGCLGPDTVYGNTTPAVVGAGAVVTNSASTPLVAIVNQITGGGVANSSAYNAFNAASATSKVSLPLIMDRAAGNLFTGIAIANVGTQPTNIACTFTGTSYTATANNVPPGGALTDSEFGKIAANYVGGGTCTATGGDAKISGIVNELNLDLPAPSDALLTYEGANF
jgi:hypothetical protein